MVSWETVDRSGETGRVVGIIAGVIAGAEVGTTVLPIPVVGTLTGAVVGGGVREQSWEVAGPSRHERHGNSPQWGCPHYQACCLEGNVDG